MRWQPARNQSATEGGIASETSAAYTPAINVANPADGSMASSNSASSLLVVNGQATAIHSSRIGAGEPGGIAASTPLSLPVTQKRKMHAGCNADRPDRLDVVDAGAR
jgi:hypothetical protein